MKRMGLNRRDFLKGVAASGLFTCGCAPSLISCRSPNSLLSHACFGTANMARADMTRLASHKRTHITALCDVDSKYLAAAHKLFPDARIYRNWRELLETEGDRIDSVNVSTPDHTHAPIVLAAIDRGKHVYAEKPLCHELPDCRRIEELAAKRGVVTQLGTQIAANACDLQAVDLLKSGSIGRIKRVWLFSLTGGFASGARKWPLAADPVPTTLDWKLWLDHAPYRPFSNNVYHPGRWRSWREFGSSWLGDMGSHIFSPVWLGMEMDRIRPETVRAEVIDDGWSAEYKEQFWPRLCHITWRYPGIRATGDEPFEVEWFDGVGDPKTGKHKQFMPPAWLWDLAAKTHFKTLPKQGRVIEGEDGWIISNHYSDKPEGMPAVVLKSGVKIPAKPPVAASRTHYHEFLDCCLDGGEARSRFSWSARLTETIIAGNLAQLRPGETLKMEKLLAKG